jgi:hypothetical protein
MLRRNNCLSILFSILVSCHSNTEQTAKSVTNDNLSNFFKSKNWIYPVEVSDTLFPFTNNQMKETSVWIKEKLQLWGNNILSKDSAHEALRVLSSKPYFNRNDTMIICKVFFYSKKYKDGKSMVAPDNYSIVDNRFFYTIGNPIFKINNEKVFFLGYPDYLDMDMLPDTPFNPE